MTLRSANPARILLDDYDGRPGWQWMYDLGTAIHVAIGGAITWAIHETSGITSKFLAPLLAALGPALLFLLVAYTGVAMCHSGVQMWGRAQSAFAKNPGMVPQRMMRVAQALALMLIWITLTSSVGNNFAPSGIMNDDIQAVLAAALFALSSSLLVGFWRAMFRLVEQFEASWGVGERTEADFAD